MAGKVCRRIPSSALYLHSGCICTFENSYMIRFCLFLRRKEERHSLKGVREFLEEVGSTEGLRRPLYFFTEPVLLL